MNVQPTKTATRPFDRGSFSLKIHPFLESADVAAQMVVLAEAAEAVGFEGVTISEHHGNYPMYMGQPMLACNWMLAATTTLWAAPCPTLLPLRDPRLVAEELAWTAMRFPGRIALGIASGYYEDDFRAVDVPFEDRTARFVVAIEELVTALSPTGPLADDPAVRTWPAHGGPIVSAVNSQTAARRAATHGLGILIPGHGALDVLARRVAAYRDAGGAGPVVLTKRIWIGTPPGDAAEHMVALYRDAGAPSAQTEGGPSLLTGAVDEIVEAIDHDVGTVGATCVNVRTHLPGLPFAAIEEQVALAGEVVRGLRALAS